MRRSLRLSLLGLIVLALFAVVSCSKETAKNDKAKSDKAPEKTTEAAAEEPAAEPQEKPAADALAAEEPAAEAPAAEEPAAEAPVAEEPAAETEGNEPAQAKLQDLGIDGLDIAEVGVWEAEVPDAALIQKVLDALVYTEQAPSAGKRRWTLTCKAKGETVAEVFVYPDGEWGYGGQTRGLSKDLVTLLESLPGELGIELGEGD